MPIDPWVLEEPEMTAPMEYGLVLMEPMLMVFLVMPLGFRTY